MEFLRFDLGADLRQELRNAPLDIKERIDERHKSLILHVQQYYEQKQAELQAYARDQLAEHSASQPVHKDSNNVSGFARTDAEPKLKSIVKRRPSSSDKRVSFKNSPIQLPVIDRDSPSESPESAAEDPESPSDAASPDEEAFGLEEETVTSSTETAPKAQETKRVKPYDFKMPPLDLRGLTKASRTVDSDGVAPDGGNEPAQPLHHEDLFDFENEISQGDRERPTEEGKCSELAQNHHAPLTPDSPPLSAKPKGQLLASPPRSEAHFVVGSAPISIRNSVHGLDGDGGPLSEQDQIDEDEITNPSKLSVPRNKTNELDPGSMSFSQRMEWETLSRRQAP